MYELKVLSKLNIVEKEESTGTLFIEGYANTVSKDRAGDVIPKTAWETPSALTNYLKNPIVLAYHNHSLPIGKMIGHEVTDQGLKIKASISKGAGNIYTLIEDGTLSTFSVGFGIKDAEYDSVTDTYFIKDVELHEVSVVSVPCNQDSVFSVSKSMDSQDYERFKKKVTPNTGDNKEENMTLEDIKALAQEIKETSGTSVSAEQLNQAVAEATRAAFDAAETKRLEKAAAEKAAADLEVAKKAATRAEATEAAKALVAELESKLDAKDSAFAEIVKANNDQIVSLKDEIAQIVASKSTPSMSHIARSVRGESDFEKARAEEADILTFISTVKNIGLMDSDYAKRIKAVNASSSIQVPSDGYETTFSTNLMRDIQAKLVVAPLFTEMNMNSANMTIPIAPDRTTATWVATASFGAVASTGDELSVTLTERTLKTFKLAAKVYLTEETEEDAIISLVPILRMHLVEAHAKAIDAAFLIGTGTGQPKGLATQAAAVAANAQTYVSLANSTSVKVTAAELLAARRKLGLYGINLDEIAIIISQEAYWDLIQDPEWADVQQVGQASSTKLVGEVGNIYGMKVLVSNEFAAPALSAIYAVLVNTKNFVVPRQRGVTVRSDFDVELDRTVFVATQRLNLEPLIEASAGNGKGVVAMKYAAV